jgi:copper homeostasis protein
VSRRLRLEVCVESLSGALAAVRGGADRLELCARLDLGGLTPPIELARDVVRAVPVPVHAMVRARTGDFVCREGELDLLSASIDDLRAVGVAGVVLGLLDGAGRVDRARTAALVARARPLAVTFHRAFDHARDLEEALDELIELGIERVLTSGSAPSAFEGRAALARLVERAAGRIVVMAGGGVRDHNAAEIAREGGVRELHGSVAFRLR